MQLASYSNLQGYGYPPTSLAGAMHKMGVPTHLGSPYGSTSVPPTLGLPSLGLPPHPLGGPGPPNPAAAAAAYGKDLLRR